MAHQTKITGLVLAGGAGRRVGGRDKGLISWAGKPLVQHVVERIKPQVDTVIISCNRNCERYRQFASATVHDLRPGHAGPLAGLEAAYPSIATDLLLLVSCDTPLLPDDLVLRLTTELRRSSAEVEICYAHDGHRAHYLCAALRRASLASVADFLDDGGRAVRDWFHSRGARAVDFSDSREAFMNLNAHL
ncbi:MAG: molybdenum cofactor guanylyltransferase MobA [Halioglobus sp.]|nr:molybdenum cofactor guanylyltransferase MobA [Halioglobus sp.]